jgi:Transposase IS116/IS110/IS902 family
MAPRLAVTFGTQMDRFDSAAQVQQFSGTAPVTVSSGKQRRVHWRWASPVFHRQTAHEYARISMGSSRWARAYFKMLKVRGRTTQAAIRALAYKWQRIQFRCWKDQLPYQEEKYLQSLQTKNSPLLAYL